MSNELTTFYPAGIHLVLGEFAVPDSFADLDETSWVFEWRYVGNITIKNLCRLAIFIGRIGPNPLTDKRNELRLPSKFETKQVFVQGNTHYFPSFVHHPWQSYLWAKANSQPLVSR